MDDISKNGSTDAAWLDAAYDLLTDSGVEAVKVMPLAKKLGVSRTGFYWHFRDREALLEAMVRRWEEKNTGNLVARTEAYAESIVEAMFNLFDCWLDDDLFDAKLDLAIRNWARNDPDLQRRLDNADQRRQEALTNMFLRFGFKEEQARVRAMTVMYTQVGYISMQIEENRETRLGNMPDYVEVFTGVKPSDSDISRFMSRHE
ncbi:TetR/AcrR family transcriptional regulator [Ruegeria sediminis]|uniref:TetR/AcrR family transcriptional regulator n=1 Tax=Ruegeria sediminis TaxID=2583820 RepID=A0ABY2WUQ1_9RHOB|nr:TetR/AcrR family transcriptional regulator [Ruegeria sediminis]TMV06327.1 TetR/AcrR family transcriptional regulator [Ruegeria sediminis]